MTIGNKLKAGLPKCSMWQFSVFVSSSVSRSILLWCPNSANECWCICIWQNSSDWQLLIKMHHPLVLFFLIHMELNWECAGFLSLPQGLSLQYNDNTASLGTDFMFCETVKRVNYFQCFRGWASVRILKKKRQLLHIKGINVFSSLFSPSSPISPPHKWRNKAAAFWLSSWTLITLLSLVSRTRRLWGIY